MKTSLKWQKIQAALLFPRVTFGIRSNCNSVYIIEREKKTGDIVPGQDVTQI